MARSGAVSASLAGPAVEARPYAEAKAVEKADTYAGPCAGPGAETSTAANTGA